MSELPAEPAALAAEELGRILHACERARYQPIDRLPSAQDFHAMLDAAEQLLANVR